MVNIIRLVIPLMWLRGKRGRIKQHGSNISRETPDLFSPHSSCFSRALGATSAEGDRAALSTLTGCTLAHRVLGPTNFTFNPYTRSTAFCFFFGVRRPYLNGVLEGSYRALCLSRAGPDGATSSCRKVAMYLEGGPPKSSSLFCRTCSQRCSVFNTAWHRGEPTGRSAAGGRGRGEKTHASKQRHNWIRRKIKEEGWNEAAPVDIPDAIRWECQRRILAITH